ncbi:MAG: A/G-specific adenine glycosylase [Clostridia bacterium]|nr:A/G-specific adenine glycosylase [Clostridia bacterium]
MFSALLLAWYDEHKRVLPFRGTKDAYRVWVSEIMLQQTRTETVSGYYTRFINRFPDLFALAEAPEEDVLKCWEGLGYYSRARNLHKAARTVVEKYGGVFPADLEALRALPGVGDYTAAAVASIAFDLPAPAMDGNLTRVLSRFHGVREDVDIPAVKRQLLALGQEDMPPVRCGDFNQALMDLGATVCTPGTPDCDACPLRPLCNAYREGDADALPVKAAAKPPKEIQMAVALITCKNKIWMIQRKETLLKNLWVYQLTEDYEQARDIEKALHALGIRAKQAEALGPARHVFTHRIWSMTLYHYEAESADCKEGRFVTLPEMLALPIPTAMKAAKEQAIRLLTPAVLPAEEGQLPALADVYSISWRESHAAHCSLDFLEKHTAEAMEAKLREHARQGRSVYGLWMANKAVGVLILDEKENELSALYIHPDDQGMGVGRAAVAFAVHALNAGKPMKLTVLCGNERANRLYASFGFTQEAACRVLDAERNLFEHDLLRLPESKKEERP